MLSSNNSFRLAKMALALAAALLVSACFRPLYGPTASGQSARAVLGSIDVKPIPDIAGHYLREELLFLFTGGAESVSSDAAYTLTVKLAESSQAVALDSTGGRADAASFTITATYTLADLKGKKLNEGTVSASASIDRLSQRFAAVRAVRDARIRVSKTLAEQIEANLTAYFSSKS
jgi:LPS-assembly lipoprotein